MNLLSTSWSQCLVLHNISFPAYNEKLEDCSRHLIISHYTYNKSQNVCVYAIHCKVYHIRGSDHIFRYTYYDKDYSQERIALRSQSEKKKFAFQTVNNTENLTLKKKRKSVMFFVWNICNIQEAKSYMSQTLHFAGE